MDGMAKNHGRKAVREEKRGHTQRKSWDKILRAAAPLKGTTLLGAGTAPDLSESH